MLRFLFIAALILHGLIHFMGFAKGFQLAELKSLTLPISKPMGLLWLVAALLFVSAAIMYIANSAQWWMIAIPALVISQLLLFIFWQDSKFGTILNLIILMVVAPYIGEYFFMKKVQKERSGLITNASNLDTGVLIMEDTYTLPEPVRQWLLKTGAIGKPIIKNARIMQCAKMKMKPEQKEWYEATAIQYSQTEPPGFIWTVDLKMNSLMYFRGRDMFQNGKGQMLIKANSLIPVVNAQGEKMDEGTVQRFLGELVWMPSLALSRYCPKKCVK